jgi:ketosteroid isomerase-like protein
MRILTAAALLLTLAAAPVFAADSAQAILDRHVATIKAGDLNGVMADYADNAVVITPAGLVPGQPDVSGTNIFEGKANVRKVFAVLTNKQNNAAIKTMQQTYEFKGSDTILMRWTQFKGTPKQVSGTDIWVIRGGKVITQILLADAPKK